MTGSTTPQNTKQSEFTEDVRKIIASSPESSPSRSLNPNLSGPELDTSAIGSPPPLPKRRSTLRRKKPVGENPFLKPTENGLARTVKQTQPFWKFHILKFGSGLYLTTNPTLRHLHCRNAPGYFVKISGNQFEYSMAFEDMESGELLVQIDKVAHKRSSYFEYVVTSKRTLRDGSVQGTARHENLIEPENDREHGMDNKGRPFLSKEKSSNGEKSGSSRDTTLPFSGRMSREPIPSSLLPTPPITPMTSYATTLMDAQGYSVGSLPRYKAPGDVHDTKYIAKKNVYLHRCFADLGRYSEWAIPPAIAVYRECEARPKKRVMRQLNRLSRVGSVLAKEKKAGKEGLSRAEPSPYSDAASFYKCGDGTYFDKVPADDEPDHHHKLGWVTIYEDSRLMATPGVFDLAVASTVAIGYERNLSFGHMEHEGP